VTGFNSSDLDMENKQCAGRPKLIKDAELEALVNEYPCQTQEEHA